MDYHLSATAEERIFLCGYNRVRRYGTTQRVSHNKPVQLIEHITQSEDTIPGLALRYNSSITDIKRINKLWSNESLFLKKSIMIPVQPDSPSVKYRLKPYTPVAPDIKSTKPPPSTEKEISMRDILSRIDSSIQNTSKTVNKLEKESSVSFADGFPSTCSPTNKRHNSLKNMNLYEYERYQ
ncbi:unnamed protein product, partial [Mesorhabditis belari]|uniref:LysM domain-containing protein n=1 Tax=Mesorhabditis belari TaxID=2138241 RepID=A0AAF3ET48_9BILA